ncbi:MAG: DUF3108 domain-containing protein [Nonlabens sp.]|nr:DUF3108 domain-containing protein [Nonlabens sp.]
MKRIILLLATILFTTTAFVSDRGTQETAFKEGEYFKFRIHYGIFNASYASLQIKNEQLNGKPVYHIVGEGKSTGLLDLFFGVEDYYETYIDRNTVKPYRFIRKINEGGYTKDLQIDFNHDNNTAIVTDNEAKRSYAQKIEPNTQDMMSAFYYLRNTVDHTALKDGDEFLVPMHFDDENFKFKLKFIGRETIRTDFGKINSLKFIPYVQSGRVFKAKESLTVYISDDYNKIPLKIKAKLRVGSITADLQSYNGLKHDINFKK